MRHSALTVSDVLFFNKFSLLRKERYCNGFAQSVSRQRLGKHVPTCNSESCVSVDECYSSLLGNSAPMNSLGRNHVTCVFCVVRAEPI
jgi:hypothetical protein